MVRHEVCWETYGLSDVCDSMITDQRQGYETSCQTLKKEAGHGRYRQEGQEQEAGTEDQQAEPRGQAEAGTTAEEARVERKFLSAHVPDAARIDVSRARELLQ